MLIGSRNRIQMCAYCFDPCISGRDGYGVGRRKEAQQETGAAVEHILTVKRASEVSQVQTVTSL